MGSKGESNNLEWIIQEICKVVTVSWCWHDKIAGEESLVVAWLWCTLCQYERPRIGHEQYSYLGTSLKRQTVDRVSYRIFC